MNYDSGTMPLARGSMRASLAQIERAQLAWRLADSEPTYIFKHALVQDSAYSSLTRHERKRLHRVVAETLERVEPNALDENAALLAYHFEHAEELDKTLLYLQRAAEAARRGAAYREQAELLRRAIDMAQRLGETQMLAPFHAQRGSALASVAAWHAANDELTRALALLPATAERARAQVLIELAAVAGWLWDMATSIRYAQEALLLAEHLGAAELAASAMTQLAWGQTSDGLARQGIENYERAFARAPTLDSLPLVRAMEFSGVVLYWLGDYETSLARNRDAFERAQKIADHVTQARGLQNLGMTLAARGAYGEALQVLEQAGQIARERGLLPWLARNLAIQGGTHLDLLDYANAEALSLRACEVAQQANFLTTAVGAGIDLIMNYTRRGEFERAERFVRNVARELPAIFGSHRWLWETRYAFARAELALARGEWDAARALSDEAIERSRATGRRKYETLALLIRAHARTRQEPNAALEDARAAYALANALGEPALILRAAVEHLKFQENETLRAAARDARLHILASLPESALHDGFSAVTSEWV